MDTRLAPEQIREPWRDPDWLSARLEVDALTCAQAAAQAGTTEGVVLYWARHLGVHHPDAGRPPRAAVARMAAAGLCPEHIAARHRISADDAARLAGASPYERSMRAHRRRPVQPRRP